jgi:hypothetical protein
MTRSLTSFSIPPARVFPPSPIHLLVSILYVQVDSGVNGSVVIVLMMMMPEDDVSDN